MKIQLGVGNSVTAVFGAAAKTLTFSGAYNFDIDPSSLSVYNVTRSAYMIGGTSKNTGTVATTLVAGLLVQTVILSAVPASSADADSLVIYFECPSETALYNSSVKKV